jgi:formylglycine-generating enzyme required for sulfatase activity
VVKLPTTGYDTAILKFRESHRTVRQFAPADDCPVNVSWYSAAAYCNWLSYLEGIPRAEWCYAANEEGEFAVGMKVRPNHLRLTGYRLPTETEWEFACRAGAETSRSFGQTEELLGKYAWYTKNSLDRQMLPTGSLKPNDLGVFDMLGNASEWCQDPMTTHGDGDDELWHDTKQVVNESPTRAARGGSFSSQMWNVRCGTRVFLVPGTRFTVGFRPARTIR